jgi:hypothetical protein
MEDDHDARVANAAAMDRLADDPAIGEIIRITKEKMEDGEPRTVIFATEIVQEIWGSNGNSGHSRRVAGVMKQLGWRPQRINGRSGYLSPSLTTGVSEEELERNGYYED